jgi:hypothetical protein
MRDDTFGDGQGGAPLVTQDVQTDAAVGVDVWMVYAGGEVDLRGLEGVVGGEVDGEEEDAARVGRVGLRGQPAERGGERVRTGPMMVACQWNRSSPMGPAEHEEGGSLQRELACGEVGHHIEG